MLAKTVLLWFLMLAVFLVREEPRQEFILHGFAQGTAYTIKYFAVKLMVSQREVDSILAQVDSSMSLYKPYSLINRFNYSTKGLSIDNHFKEVMRHSFALYKDTEGKFDVTVAPLVNAWGFGVAPVDHFPDSAAVTLLLKNVGMDKLRLKGDQLLKLKPGVTVDLNGIAQGYSVDLVAAYLSSKGISSFVVEIGGELRAKGLKPDGSRRRIGIEGPGYDRQAAVQFRHVLGIKDGAITTSGNYQKYLWDGAKKRSHLIDPKSGFPLDNQMISVTVYAREAVTADGYDNALMAMDLPEAMAFVNARKELEAYFIYHLKDGSVKDTMTLGFKKMIVN